VFPAEFGCLDQGHVVLVALDEVVLVHFFAALDTFAGVVSTCMVRFITTKYIMKTVACKTCKNMSIFKTSSFPIWISHGGGVKKVGVDTRVFKGLICDKFVVAISFREGEFSPQVVNEIARCS
jgi:hypothetical protein